MNSPVRKEPLPTGGRIGMQIGNSLIEKGLGPARSGSAPAKLKQYKASNIAAHIRRRMKFPWTEIYHSGVSGSTTLEVAARLSDVIYAPVDADFVWVTLGGNEGLQDVDIITESIPSLKHTLLRIKDAGKVPVLSLDWGPHNADHVKQAALNHFRMHMWLWCELNGIAFVDIVSAMVRYGTQATHTGLSWTRSTTSLTVLDAAHTNDVGDWVIISGFDAALDGSRQVKTVTAGVSYVLDVPPSGAASGSVGVATRSHTRPAFTIDGLHDSPLGGSYVAEDVADNFAQFPIFGSHPLACENQDYANMCGAGNPLAGSPATTLVSVGNPHGSGTVADGWLVDTMSGSGSAVITTSLTALPKPLEQQKAQTIEIVNAATLTGHVHAYTRSTIPAAWQVNTVTAVGDWKLPPTGGGRLWLCCVAVSGDTRTALGSFGTTISETATPVGTLIVDDMVTWEVRRGWIVGDTVFAICEVTLDAAAELGVQVPPGEITSVVSALTLGIHQSASAAGSNDIIDMAYDNASLIDDLSRPYGIALRVGQKYILRTPADVISGSPTSLYVGCKFGVIEGLNNAARVSITRKNFVNMTALGL